MKSLVLALVSAFTLFHASEALLGLSPPTWTTLRVTWGLRVWKSSVFWEVPLTTTKAIEKDFTKIPESTSCQGKFYGYRYANDNDTSLVLLYDSNGNIAGIQSGFPKHLISPSTQEAWFRKNDLFVDDEINGVATYTLTAYFIPTNKICSNSRTEEELEENPIGTKLSIQYKGTPKTFMEIPMQEEDVEATGWTKGKCFHTMGMHYWYNTTEDMDCDNLKPAFLMYNRDTLTGFGWAVPNMYTFSDRYEHPTKDVFGRFLDPVPTCLLDMYDIAEGFTTMHVYMNVKPWNMMC